MAVPVPASRNALCPCGSGRRYKDCHGSLAARGDGDPAAAAAPRHAALMQEALALQQAGDVMAAMSRYETVLADDPANFDALHMLGVAYYQIHAFEAAERTLRKAVAWKPDVVAAQQNLAVVIEAQRLLRMEDQLCRDVLPRLAHLCAPADAFGSAVGRAERIDVLMGTRDAPAGDEVLERIAAGALGPARLHAVPLRTPSAGASHLDAPVLLLYGTDETLATWGAPRADAVRVLVVTRDAPARIHDRLGELSGFGRHRVHVRYASEAVQRAIALPGALLFGRDAVHASPLRMS